MHWTITGVKPAYYLKLFWSMWCPEISISRILCMGLVLYPEESMALLHSWFSMSFYITSKKKTLACGSQEGHMWVTSGLLYGSLGQVGQQVWPTFNPDKVYIKPLVINSLGRGHTHIPTVHTGSILVNQAHRPQAGTPGLKRKSPQQWLWQLSK